MEGLPVDEVLERVLAVHGDHRDSLAVVAIQARIERHLKGIWKFSTEARVGERIAAQAKMMCALRNA